MKTKHGWLWSVFFPQRCILCGEVVHYKEGCCPECRSRFPLREDARVTGVEQPAGGWKCLAPASYEGYAREKLLDFKKVEHKGYADYFAEICLAALGRCWPDERWDLVAFVPGYGKDGGTKYNPARVLARRIAAGLGVPMEKRALCLVREKQPQKTLNAIQRRENVRDAFSAGDAELSGKRILLVDDIITTGATMDACVKALLLAGAGEVKCIAVGTTSLDHAAEEEKSASSEEE